MKRFFLIAMLLLVYSCAPVTTVDAEQYKSVVKQVFLYEHKTLAFATFSYLSQDDELVMMEHTDNRNRLRSVAVFNEATSSCWFLEDKNGLTMRYRANNEDPPIIIVIALDTVTDLKAVINRFCSEQVAGCYFDSLDSIKVAAFAKLIRLK